MPGAHRFAGSAGHRMVPADDPRHDPPPAGRARAPRRMNPPALSSRSQRQQRIRGRRRGPGGVCPPPRGCLGPPDRVTAHHGRLTVRIGAVSTDHGTNGHGRNGHALRRRLTPKQARFIAEFPIDCNGAAAARRAGNLADGKGGRARANALTPEQRRQIAKEAAKARWG